MTQQPDPGPDRGPRRPSRPVSRPPRLRPTTGPGAGREPAGGPGQVLRTLGGALLAVAAVSLGIVVLLAVRSGGGDDALRAEGGGVARAEPTTPPAGASASPSPPPGPSPPPPGEAPSPTPAVPTDVTVSVLGVGGRGVAEPTAERLRSGGWDVRVIASYRGQPPGATTVLHVQGREGAAALLAAQAGASAVRPAPATLRQSDLTLVVSG